ncbi:MAG: carotenoid biosynthesis protein [Kurthia sp.]|nr:carotenoid biosynthesis protein [Candidatus Kurthia equi]
MIPSWLEWANSVFLILAGLVALLYATETFGLFKGLTLSILVGVTTFFVEGFSAKYDVFFGNYDYTDRFPPLLFGVPIGIGFAWIVMIMAGHALVANIKNRWFAILIAASYVVVLDLLLDPVAFVAKEYWIWASSSTYYGIPWTNFMGWFIIAFVWQFILSFFSSTTAPLAAKHAIIVFYTIVILFAVIALVHALYLALFVAIIGFIIVEGMRRWRYEKE